MVSGFFRKGFLRALFLCCVLEMASINGAIEIKDKKRVKEMVVSTSTVIKEELQKSKTLTKLFSMNFEEIPASLKGVGEWQVEYHIKVLMRERRQLQRRMIYHMTQCWVVAVGSYFLDKPFMVPYIDMILIEDEGRRRNLEDLWAKHQQRMTDFVLEYIKVKNIIPETLPQNTAGVAYVRASAGHDHQGHDKWEQLPVYVTKKGDPLPPFATDITPSASRIMKSWWSAPDKPKN